MPPSDVTLVFFVDSSVVAAVVVVVARAGRLFAVESVLHGF